jgi:hypothetical protein
VDSFSSLLFHAPEKGTIESPGSRRHDHRRQGSSSLSAQGLEATHDLGTVDFNSGSLTKTSVFRIPRGTTPQNTGENHAN